MRRHSVLILMLLATACREAPAPFSIDDPFNHDSIGRLTYNAYGDHAPAWSGSPDSVFYAARTYPGLPSSKGMLLGVARQGSIATPILPAVQLAGTTRPWLAAPAFSADGGRIAFFHLTDVRDQEFDRVVCPFPALSPQFDTLGTSSILQEAVLRVREVNSTVVEDAARLVVRFAGRTTAPNDQTQITNIAHPFQRLFEAEGVPIFRATWSPDGSRLAYSDGTSIRIWTIGQANSVALAGTEDGIMPAWSPDGTLIAFSKPFRGSTQRINCIAQMNGQVLPAAYFTRTIYTPLTREDAQLMLIRPDGTGLRSLGIGDAPAWTADSRSVIAHRDRSLFRVPIDGAAATQLANTLNAFEPALSRNGNFLAFARRTETGSGEGESNSRGNYDIWVAPF